MVCLSLSSREHNAIVFHLHSSGWPSCLHTTLASLVPKKSSQTVPHCPPRQISILPSVSVTPPMRRISPLVQSNAAEEVDGIIGTNELTVHINLISSISLQLQLTVMELIFIAYFEEGIGLQLLACVYKCLVRDLTGSQQVSPLLHYRRRWTTRWGHPRQGQKMRHSKGHCLQQ